jgi:choline monooxygenase
MQRFFIDANIARAHTLDTAFYCEPQYFHAAKEKLFAPLWQYIGDADMLQGNAYPFTLLDGYMNEPLLLTKDAVGNVRCMSNVCTHRGNLLVTEPCKLHNIRCKYHGRQFGLDGGFMSMPEFKEVEGFPSEADNLHNLTVFNWGKLLFTSLQATIPAQDVFADMMQRMHWFPMDKLRMVKERSREFTVKANWALYCENYLEGFHIPFVHAGLNQVLDFGEYTTELFRYSNLQLGIGKKGDVCFDLPASSPDYGKEVAAYYFWVFPNMMFNFYPWGLSLNIVLPQSPDECKVQFITYVLDDSKLDTGAYRRDGR